MTVENATFDHSNPPKEYTVIPYTAYDIIAAVNREYDLRRPPLREPDDMYRSDGTPPAQDDQGHGRGPGHPVPQRFVVRVTAAFRSLSSRRPQPQSAQAS